jgi:hypothetical protein
MKRVKFSANIKLGSFYLCGIRSPGQFRSVGIALPMKEYDNGDFYGRMLVIQSDAGVSLKPFMSTMHDSKESLILLRMLKGKEVKIAQRIISKALTNFFKGETEIDFEGGSFTEYVVGLGRDAK